MFSSFLFIAACVLIYIYISLEFVCFVCSYLSLSTFRP